jgi:hypothetical protein
MERTTTRWILSANPSSSGSAVIAVSSSTMANGNGHPIAKPVGRLADTNSPAKHAGISPARAAASVI